MSTQPPKSIGEAINDFTEDDVPADEPEVADEETDNTNVDEGEAQGAKTDETSEEESAEDEGEDEDEADSESEFPDGQPTGVDEEEEDDDEEDFFDNLTPEDLSIIKGSPELTKVRKLLLRGYNKKMEGKDQLLRLGEAYEKDPVGILRAIAASQGYQLAGGPQQQPQQKPEDKLGEARQKVEKLFGAAGPNVRQTLDEYWEVLNNQKLGPVQETLGRVMSEHETTRMQSEENAWRERHKSELNPKLVAEVVKLGNSGRYVPGKNTTPAQFLDDLLIIAKAKYAESATKEAKTEASRKLAERIKKNKMNREPGGISSKAKVDKVSRLQSEPWSFQSIGDAIAYADQELTEEG